MAIEFNKVKFDGHTPEIWRGEAKILPAGFKPKNNIRLGTVLRRGTPLAIDIAQLQAAVVKVAYVLEGGTTTKARVAKTHLFEVGDVVAKVGVDNASRTISSIDTTNDGYDVLTLNSAITGLTENDILVEAQEYGYVDAEEGEEGALKIVASNPSTGQIAVASVTPYLGEGTPTANNYVKLQSSTAKYQPNAVVGAVKEFDGKGLPTIDAAYEAVVLYPSLTFPVLPEWLVEGGFTLKSNQNILFIKQ